MTKTVKAKRSLSSIDFSKEDSHIALVGPAVGGPANGHDYALVMKAVNFSEEAIQKMQSIRVTLSVPEFLMKFFNMYYEDAQVLAQVMGYEPPADNATPDIASYQDYIDSRVQSIEVLKSLRKAEDYTKILAELDESQYLSLLQDQAELEKSLTEKSEPVAKAKGDDTSIASEVNKEVSTSNPKQLEKQTMTTPTVEMVEKSQLAALQKSFDEQTELLQKALESVAKFEAEKKEAIAKARKLKLVAAVKDEAKADVLFKALSLVETDEDFDAVVATLTDMATAVEKSALFEEKGAATSAEAPVVPEQSAVAKAVKARLEKSAK